MNIPKRSNTHGPLMATDALDRTTPDAFTGAPAPRGNRLVGLFYFLWLGEHGRKGPYDISKIVAEDPDIGYKPHSDKWGGVGVYHHWGEPFYGYYCSDDEWVIRRHMKLIMQADIDFLFFDTTNAVIYENNAKLVMRVLEEYYNDGCKIPQVMFYTNTKSGDTVQKIYDDVYKCEYCKDTWFCLDGKPVIIANESECSEETKAFFNIKMSQWPNEADKLGGWPWMDFTRPQRVFCDLFGKEEVINVSVAQHPQLRFGDSVLYGEEGNCGRAFHDGKNDPNPEAYKYGYNFAEQFERAIEADPPIVLVTGWNEWIAGYWNGISERPCMFVDCANYEYSRDIEMMRGGYFDNYFMQLVSFVRRYKGVSESEIFIENDNKHAVYYNFSDGDIPRYAEGYGGKIYENRTQRNSINSIEVWHDEKFLSFKIKTKSDVTKYGGNGSWMKLYINTSGGRGYQYIINNTPYENGKTTVAKVIGIGNDLSCEDMTDVSICYNTCGNEFEITVPRSTLDIDSKDFTIWFKAADSTEEYRSVEDFYDKGDVAPLGRLNFVYRGKKSSCKAQ